MEFNGKNGELRTARLARHAGKGQSIGACAHCTMRPQAMEMQVERDECLYLI